MKPLTLLVIATLSLGLSKTLGAGVAVVKEQSFHSDDTAKPVVFLEMVDEGAPFIKFKTSKGDFIIDKVKIRGIVEIPDFIPATITQEAEIAPLRNACKKIEDFSNKYSKTRALLADSLRKLKTVIEKFDGGEIRYNSNWITKNEFLTIQSRINEQIASVAAADKQLAEERQKAEKQRLEYEESQRSKGLAKYNNQWMPVAEAQRLEMQAHKDLAEAQQAALERTQQQKSMESQLRIEALRLDAAERAARQVEINDQRDAAEAQRIKAEIAEQEAAKAGNINAFLRQAAKGQLGVDQKLQTRVRSGDPYAAIELEAQLARNRVAQDLAAARISQHEASIQKIAIQAELQQKQSLLEQEEILREQRKTNNELNRIGNELERKRYQRR